MRSLKQLNLLLIARTLKFKKKTEEKKAALAAQFDAEATPRRVHAAQKDDGLPPIEAIIASLEAELKLVRQWRLQYCRMANKALERLKIPRKLALLEAEKIVQIAMAELSLVDDLQHKNQELMKQIQICQLKFSLSPNTIATYIWIPVVEDDDPFDAGSNHKQPKML